MQPLALLGRKLADLSERNIHLVQEILVADTRLPDLEEGLDGGMYIISEITMKKRYTEREAGGTKYFKNLVGCNHNRFGVFCSQENNHAFHFSWRLG